MKKFFVESIGTVLGSLLMSIAISFFLLPNELSSGGFSGIATIFYYLLKIPVGITMLCLNIPFFLFSGYKIGKSFFAKSVIGTVSLSLFTDMFDEYGALTTDRILACVYGGVLMGIGTAIILKVHSSTGGSDLVSAIVKKFNPKVEMGRVIVMMDFIVVLLNVIFLRNIEIGLYSAITIYLMGFMVDIVFEGVFFCKLMVIISDKSELISKEIENKIYRGVTGIYGKGMYTGTDKLVLMCATYRREVANIKELIMKIDKDAFVIVTNSREVFGDGFKRNV